MEKKLSLLLVLFMILFSVLPFSAGAADEENYLEYTSSGNAFGAGDNLQIDRISREIWCLQGPCLR